MASCLVSNGCSWSGTSGCNKGNDMLLARDHLPETIIDIAALDDLLCRPSQALIDDLKAVDGDIMVLGVAGKMGPTLAGLAKAALPDRRVIGVARFSDPAVEQWLKVKGIETIHCDLLDEAERGVLDRLRLSVCAGERRGLRRKHAPQPPRRICPVLRRTRAHVRIFLAQVCNAGPPVPAQLCDRHALWRAARH